MHVQNLRAKTKKENSEIINEVQFLFFFSNFSKSV